MPAQANSKVDAEVRVARLLERLARPVPPRKLQHIVEQLAAFWRGPAHLHFCVGGRSYWQVLPTAHAVFGVAAHARARCVEVRRAVACALAAAASYSEIPAAGLLALLADEHALVRLPAAQAASTYPPCEALRIILLDRLADPVWTVRWYAAAAVGRLGELDRAAATLLASEPPPGRHHAAWVTAAQSVQPAPAVLRERLAALQTAPGIHDLASS